MAKTSGRSRSTSTTTSRTTDEILGDDDNALETGMPVEDRLHPDYVEGLLSDPDAIRALTPTPDGPVPPLPGPFPGPIPGPFPPGPFPPGPTIPELPIPPIPNLPLPLNFCGPVSGRYRSGSPPILTPPLAPPALPSVPSLPTIPPIITRTTLIVRVDVDRYYPQRRISIEASRIFPNQRAHAIAEVTRDVCSGLFNRRVDANITYRDGLASLIPGVRLVFEARRTVRPFGYGSYTLTLIEANGTQHVHSLEFQSQYFDVVEFEVDVVSNATPVVTSYNTGSHPNRPASLPAEVISLATVFNRAGFDATMSPNANIIPTSGAGANGTWSDAEMHNAMITHWSRFSNQPKWAMWVLFAARHDMGSSLGGIMFDDIGPNHRQGTAIFTNSFIVNAPAGDPNPGAWRNRNVFWTTVHEMGHAFNLAHSWQKSLGNPWIPLANQPEARSFMNYPNSVAGGQQAFFSDFAFRFSDSELLFMRHAPRRFVQMGNEAWFSNHGFEEVPEMDLLGLKLHLRANRPENVFDFLEPTKLELKLENRTDQTIRVEEDILSDGSHIAILVRRDGGGDTKRWRPLAIYCNQHKDRELKAGESIYASHFVGASTDGWLIDEPGFYSIQAAIEIDGVVVVSNPLRIFVGTPDTKEEEKIAPDYFTEDVARALAFNGAPSLTEATKTLEKVVAEVPDTAAATHATVALSDPLKRDFKMLEGEGEDAVVTAKPADAAAAAAREIPVLVDKADEAAETMGHIEYRTTVEDLTDALVESGDTKKAKTVQKSLVDTLKRRGVLPAVIAASEQKLDRISG